MIGFRRMVLAGTLAAAGGCGVTGDDFDGSALAGRARAEPDSAGRANVLQGVREDGADAYVERIDGDISSVFRAEIVPLGLQHVVFTGIGPGTDQSSVIVFDEDGRRISRHRVSGDAPFGRGHHLLQPTAARLTPFEHDGRRWIAIMTSGLWDPYSVEILEIVGSGQLVPRYRFWNPGVFSTPVVGDGLVAFRCLNNDLRDANRDLHYPVAVGVVSMADVVDASRRGGAGVGAGPHAKTGGGVTNGTGYVRYFLLSERDHRHRQVPLTLSIQAGRVRADTETGLTYSFDPGSDVVGIDADREYREQYAERVRRGAKLVPIEDHLEELRRAVRCFSPAAR